MSEALDRTLWWEETDHLKKPAWVDALIEQTNLINDNKYYGKITREQFLQALESVKDQAEPYTPTPTDEAMLLEILADDVCLKIQHEFAARSDIEDWDAFMREVDTFNRIGKIAERVEAHAHRLHLRLEEQDQQ